MICGYFIQPSGDKVWIEVENLYPTPPVADPAIFERGTTLEKAVFNFCPYANALMVKKKKREVLTPDPLPLDSPLSSQSLCKFYLMLRESDILPEEEPNLNFSFFGFLF